MVLFFKLTAQNTTELAQRTVKGLLGRVGVVSGNNRLVLNQPRLQAAMDITTTGLAGAVGTA